jgi:hypothetical protein
MATYEDLLNRVYRALNDPDGTTTGQDTVYDGILHAHEAILPWVPKLDSITITSGSDGTLVLPTNLYQVQSLYYVDANKFIPRLFASPGKYFPTDYDNIGWIDIPFGKLTVQPNPAEGTEFVLYCICYWNVPETEDDISFVIEAPRSAHAGLVYYAASHALVPRAVNSASIRQFNQRIDSGNPEDNPLKAEADWMLNRFFQEMKMQPAYTRVG